MGCQRRPLNGGAGDDRPEGRAGEATLNGGDGHDTINGGSGSDTTSGRTGNDYCWEDTSVDYLWGGDGNDREGSGDTEKRLFGKEGNDKLYGGAGNDHLDGSAGDDRREGGAGTNTLAGGAGAGTFVFGEESIVSNPTGDAALNAETDTVTDFPQNQGDRLDLRGLEEAKDLGSLTLCGTGVFVNTDGVGSVRYSHRTRNLLDTDPTNDTHTLHGREGGHRWVAR